MKNLSQLKPWLKQLGKSLGLGWPTPDSSKIKSDGEKE